MSAIRNKGTDSDLIITPIKMGGISKKHLTPCRRVGLCRKIAKTPSLNRSIDNSMNESLLETSLSSKCSGTSDVDMSTSLKQELPVSNVKVKKSKPLKAKKSLELEPKIRECSVVINANSKANLDCLSSFKESVAAKESDTVLNDSRHILDELHKDDNSKDTFTNSNTKCDKSKSMHILKKSKGSLKFTRNLSIKKLSDDEASDLDDPLFTNSPAIKQPVSLSSPESENKQLTELTKKSHKKAVIYSSDEEDFVPSPNSTKENSGDLNKNILDIKQRIKIKTAHLEKIQQAAVYKKLHNVDQLNEVTNVWRNGCYQALRDLIVKLQTHGPMTMTTLLQNLRIPKELIDYNSNTDSFI